MSPEKNWPYEIESCSAEEDRLRYPKGGTMIRKPGSDDDNPEKSRRTFKNLSGNYCVSNCSYTRKFIKCGKQKYVMPGNFKKCAAAIYNMEVRPDDVWVITFPRSGTTWTQELVWLLMNDLDYESSRKEPLFSRFPMLETTCLIPTIGIELMKMNFMNLGNFQGLADAARHPSWKSVAQMPRTSPRLIKTHLPLSMLPPNLLTTARVLYVARDPRDACVSYYYLQKMVARHLLRANMTHYWESFRRDLLTYTPIIPHANEAWEQRHHPNMHFMFYEDMLKDLPKEVSRVSKFLGKKYSDSQLERLSQYLRFDSLKKNRSVNNTTSEDKSGVQFIRKGEAGGWRSHFNKEMEMQAEEFLMTRLKGLTLRYPSIQKGETTHL